MIKFSVTIPAYKGKYLSEAIESVLSQTYQNYELIIVDDCSPEDLKSIVGRFTDERIKYYRNERNCGAIDVVDNWNICLGYCTGDYVICMGDDDRLLPCCLDEYNKLIKKYPGIGLVHGWTELIDEESNFVDLQIPRPEYEDVLSLIWNRWNCRHYQFIGDWCFKADLLRNDGGYHKLPLAWASDDISAVKTALHNGVANTQKICFQYRQSRYTISLSGNSDIKIEAKKEEREWYQSFLQMNYVTDLSYEDLKMRHLIESTIDEYYRKEIFQIITLDLSKRPYRITHWLKKSKGLNIGYSRIFFGLFKVMIQWFV